ncbi:MAG: hypothetical protein AB7G76_05645 [Steroidobacteraceae bacterium]
MNRTTGQALAEYVAVLAVLVAVLVLPVVGGESLVARLEAALRFHWRAWSSALLNVAGWP